MSAFSPANLPKKTVRTGSPLDLKITAKTRLQESLDWPSEPKRPLLCFPAGMTEQLGGALLEEVLPGLLNLQVEMLILGKGSTAYGKLFTKLAQEESHRVHIMTQSEEDVQTMYLASDMAIFLSDIPTKELGYCLEAGVVPIAPHMPSLEDYDPIQERGNSFLYEAPTKWLCFAALVRACETYKFPFDWRTIQKHCLESARHA